MNDLLLESVRTTFVTAVLCLTRMTVASLVTPFMGGESIQLPVRMSILASLSLMVYPMVAPTIHGVLPPALMAGVFLKEAVLGFLLGFMASKVFWIALGIGMVMDNQRGSSLSETLDPSSNEQTSPTGQFMQQALIAIFYASGGFLLFLMAMFESYRAWPVVEFFPHFSPAFLDFFLGQLDAIMRTTVVLAAPLIITLFISEFGLGLINRFAPQLNVFFLAMPVKSLVAFIVLIFYLPFLIDYFSQDIQKTGDLLDWLRGVIS